MPTGDPAAIEFQEVSIAYGSGPDATLAVSDVTFAVGAGDFVCIVGPSGSGKSTLLKVAAGILACTSGRVLGGSGENDGEHRTGLMFQAPLLLDWRNVLANVLLPTEIAGIDRQAALDKARGMLRLVGLADYEARYPFELSGGMQQRVALARALVQDPRVLLMDEPFGALDPFLRQELNQELLRIWNETGKTIVMVTHDIAEAMFLASRVVVLSARPGRILRVVDVDLPRPRAPDVKFTAEFNRLAREIEALITGTQRAAQSARG